jgi:pilus assembly protein CpaD
MTRTVTPALAALFTLGLAACASEQRTAAGPDPVLPTEQYSIEVRQHPAEIRLAPHPGGLTPPQEDALADMAQRWRAQGSGLVQVQAPAQGDMAAISATSQAARATLISLGVPAEQVQIVGYAPPPGSPPAIVVGFNAYEAVGPQCGTTFENLAVSYGNKAPQNYGCAVTANFAAQIANPGDLIQPRLMKPSDGARRSVVLDKYRKGETTSSARDDQANGTLATATGSNQ